MDGGVCTDNRNDKAQGRTPVQNDCDGAIIQVFERLFGRHSFALRELLPSALLVIAVQWLWLELCLWSLGNIVKFTVV